MTTANSADTPVVLCIDVEPDARVFDRASPPPWSGFERLLERLPSLRERLSEATGKKAAFTWCLRMDPQVAETFGSATFVAEMYGDRFAELAECGDELGVHTHVWRWDSRGGSWVADHRDPTWGQHCVTLALEAFETAFGRCCSVHRGGDHFLSGAILSVLNTHDLKVDLTVEPGWPPVETSAVSGETYVGSLPDYREVPAGPYHSSPDRFPGPDATSRSGPLLIPLLSAPRRRPPFRRETVSLWDPSRGFRNRLAVELLLRRPRVVAMAVRSELPLFPVWDTATQNLEHLARHRKMVFMTASEAVDHMSAGMSGAL